MDLKIHEVLLVPEELQVAADIYHTLRATLAVYHDVSSTKRPFSATRSKPSFGSLLERATHGTRAVDSFLDAGILEGNIARSHDVVK
jgi:hypothetical protein